MIARASIPDGSNMYWTAAINFTQPLPGSESNRFDEILIENNRIENTLCGGIKNLLRGRVQCAIV